MPIEFLYESLIHTGNILSYQINSMHKAVYKIFPLKHEIKILWEVLSYKRKFVSMYSLRIPIAEWQKWFKNRHRKRNTKRVKRFSNLMLSALNKNVVLRISIFISQRKPLNCIFEVIFFRSDVIYIDVHSLYIIVLRKVSIYKVVTIAIN